MPPLLTEICSLDSYLHKCQISWNSCFLSYIKVWKLDPILQIVTKTNWLHSKRDKRFHSNLWPSFVVILGKNNLSRGENKSTVMHMDKRVESSPLNWQELKDLSFQRTNQKVKLWFWIFILRSHRCYHKQSARCDPLLPPQKNKSNRCDPGTSSWDVAPLLLRRHKGKEWRQLVMVMVPSVHQSLTHVFLIL